MAVVGLTSSILGSFAYGFFRFKEGEAAKKAKEQQLALQRRGKNVWFED